MLSVVGSAVAALSYFMCYASALGRSALLYCNIKQTAESWFNVEYDFTSYELVEIRARIMHFIKGRITKKLITSDETAKCFQHMMPRIIADVEYARSCFLAGLASSPKLYTRFVEYIRAQDPKAQLALHKFICRKPAVPQQADADGPAVPQQLDADELEVLQQLDADELEVPQQAAPELVRNKSFKEFMDDVAKTPAILSDTEYGYYIGDDERSKFNLVALIIARADWKAKAIERELNKVIDTLGPGKDSRNYYLGLTIDIVKILYKMEYLNEDARCAAIFSKLFESARGHDALKNPKLYELMSFDDRTAGYLLDELLKLWSAGGFQWDINAMRRSQVTEAAFSEFCFRLRSFLARNPLRVLSLILETIHLRQPEKTKELDLAIWPALNEEYKKLHPKFVYSHYYLCHKAQLFILESDLQRYFDVLDNVNLVWLSKYSSKETDPSVAMSIEDFLRCMSRERQAKLYQWVRDYIDEHKVVHRAHSFYDLVKKIRDALAGFSYLSVDEPAHKKSKN
ncbi:hypothetical protein PAPHI01_1077 [Pancytospora philotis]|nr:hypothetical protein PAPHI01_1077 [Pancytospora philotis]